ncbi:MAG: hypothetical protein EBX50_02335 [Chitinophagia bacterium]|nr:hypothetical protein [Chitinophagia bacterium]
MQDNRELDALLSLIDDPDGEVYQTVTDKLMGYGLNIKPNLEHLWETTLDEAVQQRIESLMHQLDIAALEKSIDEWKSGDQNLIDGALLLSQYHQPELSKEDIWEQVDEIYKNIWLELKPSMEPMMHYEKMVQILYNYHNLRGKDININSPEDFLIHLALPKKHMNMILSAIIYQTLCDQLSFETRVVCIAGMPVIAYYRNHFLELNFTKDQIYFFVNATNGKIYLMSDIIEYLENKGIDINPQFFVPMTPDLLIRKLFLDSALCYRNKPETYFKYTELVQLANRF